MTDTQNRRAGGRAARKAARAAPLSDAMRPVRPGMQGGTYKPLTQLDMDRINEAALTALEEIGLADAPQSGIDIMVGAGAILGDDGRLRYPRALIEDMLAKANREITLNARNPKHDLHLGDKKVHYGTAGAAVHMVDVQTRSYRESTVRDLHNAARIVEHLDNIHFVQRPMVCRDIFDNREMDLNTIYACATGTEKHIGTSFTEPDFVDDALEMLHMIAGGEDKWRERPFVSNSNCFVVPPMKFATESCQVMEKCIAGGMPVLLLSAGASRCARPRRRSPVRLCRPWLNVWRDWSMSTRSSRAIRPYSGLGPSSRICATGAMSGGSGEQALLTAGCAQMHPILWSARRRGGWHCGCETARYASGMGTGHVECHGRVDRIEYGL